MQAIYTIIAISVWVAIPCGLLLLSIVIFSRRNPQQYTGDYFANAFGDVPFLQMEARATRKGAGGKAGNAARAEVRTSHSHHDGSSL